MSVFRQKNVKQVVAVIMVMALLVGICIIPQFEAYAETQRTGAIVSEGIVETKKTPSPDGEKANGLENGKPITIIEETTGSDGKLWYKIAYALKANSTIVQAYVPAESVVIEEIITYGTGTINADDVYVRNEAGSSGTYKLVSLYRGHSVEIIEETAVNGATWYRIRCISNGITHVGWTYGAYITIQSYDIETDQTFEEELRRQGFPESYIQKLSILHAKYPNWKFEAVLTGLDWNEVIAQESKPSVNLVHKSADDAKKSMSVTEYDWSKNTWIMRDGAGWVTAHPDYIAYRMDPRNYLTETNIFQFEALTYNSAHNLAGVQAIIDNTFMEGTNGVVTHEDGTSINYGETFMQVGKETNVSPYHLASRVRQEQGKGTSPLISGTYASYPGVYNYFNIKATGSTKEQIYKNGLKYASDSGWTTRYASLKGGAAFLAKSYIGVGQDTLYFQKFDVVNDEKYGLYSHQYMTNVDGAYSEGKSVASAYTDKKQTFVFRIPVYTNMPEKPVTFNVSGNRNNYLKTLSVSGVSLTPTFSGDVTEYSAVVDHTISSITVSASPVVSSATVTSGTGTHTLQAGTNTIQVKCKSESGETKTYTLTIVRQEAPVQPPAENPTDPPVSNEWALTSDVYVIGDKYIAGIQPQTNVSAFLNGLKTTNATVKVFTSSGAEKTGVMSTGDKLEVYCNGTLVMNRTIVIYGDANGDGAVDVLDIIRINRHTLGLSTLKGAYLEAADANRKGDGADVLDIIVTNRHTLGLTTIKQK
uniref:cadherin-like beta sandwich domain-containing protein n=1 Tax=Agathobacter sp. TaxID=2021311 RepID=UPI004056F007